MVVGWILFEIFPGHSTFAVTFFLARTSGLSRRGWPARATSGRGTSPRGPASSSPSTLWTTLAKSGYVQLGYIKLCFYYICFKYRWPPSMNSVTDSTKLHRLDRLLPKLVNSCFHVVVLSNTCPWFFLVPSYPTDARWGFFSCKINPIIPHMLHVTFSWFSNF